MSYNHLLRSLLLPGLVLLLASCAGVQAKPSESNFEKPSLSLELFEVPQYDGYWYYSGKVEPTKGEAGDHGAPLPMSFLFNIENPNPYPVRLQDYRFTISFEKFDLITVNNNDEYWIPAEKSEQFRATTMITVRSALLSLMVTGGFELKEKGWSPWDALERWWSKVPSYEIPVTLKDGSATFSADGVSQVVPFNITFP